MAMVPCPNCGGPSDKGGWTWANFLWGIFGCIVFLPIGVVILWATYKKARCYRCGHQELRA